MKRLQIKSKTWCLLFLAIILIILLVLSSWTVKIDPFFHYHKPLTSEYYYTLGNQRSVNDGIAKHFEYDGIITGTSRCENFRTSEAENLFGGSFVKLPFSGASFKETNDIISTAIENNPNLRMVIRGLDYDMLLNDKDRMRLDLGKYPTYLYDNNCLNDVEYILNRDVLSSVYLMEKEKRSENHLTGITTFDRYSNWMAPWRKFGRNEIYPEDTIGSIDFEGQQSLSSDEKKTVIENVRQNITSLAENNKNVTFYYFFTPFCVKMWQTWWSEGNAIKQLEAEKIAIEEILKCENIRLFSYNCDTEITADLNNYKDITHYGEWINSLILKRMRDGAGLLTPSNYNEYLIMEKELYENFDYPSLLLQEDYENDGYAAALLDYEIYGIKPKQIEVLKNNVDFVADYGYKYLVCYGKRISGEGNPHIIIRNNSGEEVAQLTEIGDNNDAWKQYLIDLSGAIKSGEIYEIFLNNFDENDDSSLYEYKDLILY